MGITPEEAQQVLSRADRLFDRAAVEQALDRMAREISAKIGEKNPLVLCVMTGGVIPTGHLLTRFQFPLQLDYVHATRYTGKTRGGELVWIARPQHSLKDRCVLIIDDIYDEGVTLTSLVASCREEGAVEVYTAALVEKLHDRKTEYNVDFIGLQVADRYVFGYGMDYKDYHRNVDGIYAENS